MSKLILFLLLFLNISVFGQKDARLEGVEGEIENLMKAYKAVGVSVAVVENNQVVYSKGFGYRDLEKKLPVNENTVFPVGSITKSFTSSLIGILQDQNKLSVNDKPSWHIPKLQFYNDRMDNLITISDLMCHRSGIGTADGSYTFFPADKRQDLMGRLKYIKPNGAINNSWIYSNFGYVILGNIVDSAAGKSWEDYLQENIFDPLQMTSSSTDNNAMFATNNYSFGYGLLDGNVKKVLFEQLKSEKPVGGINSTAKDLTNYVRMWLNDGVFADKNILSKSFVQQAISLKSIENGLPPEESDPDVFAFGYGYGWKINSHKGHYKVQHGGNISGFSTQLVMFPTDKLGFVVLTNQESSLLPYIVGDIIANRMLRLTRVNWDKYPLKVAEIHTISTSIKPINADKKPTHNLADFCGKYTNPGYGTFEITKEGDDLFITFPRDKFRLEHQYHDIFMMKAIKEMSQYFNPEFYLNFNLDYAGNIESVKINFQNEPVEFTKQP